MACCTGCSEDTPVSGVGAMAAALGLLGGCATPQALLLPGEDGHDTGALAVLGADGQVLKRGPDLGAVLRPLERKLIRPVD